MESSLGDFHPQTTNLPALLRLADFFKEVFFLEPIAAYPIGMWNSHLISLLDSLSEPSREFIECYYGLKIVQLAANEVREKKNAAISEIRQTPDYEQISKLVNEYENHFFCDFSYSDQCASCDRFKQSAELSPICSAAILKVSYRSKIDSSLKNLPVSQIQPEKSETNLPEDLEDDLAELSENQVETVLRHFQISKSKGKVGGIESDSRLLELPVIVWRLRTVFDQNAADAFLELVGNNPLILFLEESLATELVLPNISIVKFPDSVLSDEAAFFEENSPVLPTFVQ